MEIGRPQRVITVEPAIPVVPERQPATPDREPAKVPDREPDREPVKV